MKVSANPLPRTTEVPKARLARVRPRRGSLPVAALIWLMIIPMLLKIDFAALHQVKEHWKGVGVTLFVNWAVKPFSMALLAWLFIRGVFAPYLPAEQADAYVAALAASDAQILRRG